MRLQLQWCIYNYMKCEGVHLELQTCVYYYNRPDANIVPLWYPLVKKNVRTMQQM